MAPPDIRSEICSMLASSVGDQMSEELVTRVSTELRFDPATLSVREGFEVLERVAQAPGVVGIAARFAKTRLILKWGAPKT